MSGFLSQNAAKPKRRNPLITIVGDAGLGKTSLAATFPNPLFIRAEDGMNSLIHLDTLPDALPVLTRGDDIWQQLRAVLKEEHNYHTLVIDSVSALDRLFAEDLIAEDYETRKRKDNDAKPVGLNMLYGGYGAGFAALAAKHERVRRGAGAINLERGMTIVFLAHADTEQVDLPDQDPYMRFNLRMTRKCIPPYVDGVDLVGFLRLQSFIAGGKPSAGKSPAKAGKASSFGARQLICHATAANVSKNRYGITEPITIEPGQNPLLSILQEVNHETLAA